MIPKLRAWDTLNKMFVKIYDISVDFDMGDPREYITEIGTETFDFGTLVENENIENIILMQSTELRDQYGVEIFDGDIIKLDDYSRGSITAKVIKENGAWGIVGINREIIEVVPKNWNDNFLTFAYLAWLYEHPNNEVLNGTVIGNIYKNPELLKEMK